MNAWGLEPHSTAVSPSCVPLNVPLGPRLDLCLYLLDGQAEEIRTQQGEGSQGWAMDWAEG